jgi:hypothetical protein
MNNDVIGMVGECADTKSNWQTQPPVCEPQVAHSKRDCCLHDQDRDRDQRSPRIPYHQLANFRMRLDDRSCSPGMRLVRFRLVKRGLHGPSNYCIAGASSIALFHRGNPPDCLSQAGRGCQSMLFQAKSAHRAVAAAQNSQRRSGVPGNASAGSIEPLKKTRQ